jgi:hypothetical protein
VRDAVLAMLGWSFVVALVLVLVAVVVVVVERSMKYDVSQGSDVESEQPETTGDERRTRPLPFSDYGPSKHVAARVSALTCAVTRLGARRVP